MKRLPSFAFTAVAAFIVAAAVQLAASAAVAQRLVMPRPSPNASVSQTIGITEVTVHYSRPGVKGRVIWGKLVPYGEVWRTGANENTTVTFSTPVKIEGKELPAGTYGLQTLPTENDWTVIFSKDAELWGAFDYKPDHDALRVQVKPQPAEPQEWMGFEFTDLTDSSASLVLRWEKLRLPLHLQVDTPKLVAARPELRWQAPYAAASYCLQRDACLDEASRWLDASIALEPTFQNQSAKATLLAKRNDFAGAVSFGEKALRAAKSATQPPSATQVSELETKIAKWKGGK
jgi:hypothetical protein